MVWRELSAWISDVEQRVTYEDTRPGPTRLNFEKRSSSVGLDVLRLTGD